MQNQEKIKEERGITAITLIIIAVVVMLVIIILANTIGKKKPLETGTKAKETSQNTKAEKEEYVHIMEDGSKLNVSEEMQKDKKVNNLEITNVQLKETEGITTLLADVENKGKEDREEKAVTVEILDKEGNIITAIEGPIDEIKAGEKIKLNFSVTGDISNAYNFRIIE